MIPFYHSFGDLYKFSSWNHASSISVTS